MHGPVRALRGDKPHMGKGLAPWPAGFVLIEAFEKLLKIVPPNLPIAIYEGCISDKICKNCKFCKRQRPQPQLLNFVLASQWDSHCMWSCMVSVASH